MAKTHLAEYVQEMNEVFSTYKYKPKAGHTASSIARLMVNHCMTCALRIWFEHVEKA
jgi:hypothetical protein